jgi:Xaa-Pro aminopeptidase
MLGFEPLTLVPIDKNLVNVKLMTQPERDWLDTYHAAVYKALSPLIADETKAWLTKATSILDK